MLMKCVKNIEKRNYIAKVTFNFVVCVIQSPFVISQIKTPVEPGSDFRYEEL